MISSNEFYKVISAISRHGFSSPLMSKEKAILDLDKILNNLSVSSIETTKILPDIIFVTEDQQIDTDILTSRTIVWEENQGEDVYYVSWFLNIEENTTLTFVGFPEEITELLENNILNGAGYYSLFFSMSRGQVTAAQLHESPFVVPTEEQPPRVVAFIVEDITPSKGLLIFDKACTGDLTNLSFTGSLSDINLVSIDAGLGSTTWTIDLSRPLVNADMGNLVYGSLNTITSVVNNLSLLSGTTPVTNQVLGEELVITPSPLDSSSNIDISTTITLSMSKPIRQVGGAEITDANVATLLSLTYPQLLQDKDFTATINPTKTLITINPTTDLLYNREVELILSDVETFDSVPVGHTTTITFTTQVAVFDPESISNIAFSLVSSSIVETDGEEVLTWLDSSLEVKPATATSGSAPIASTVDGVKVLRFNGVDQIMDVDAVSGIGGVDVFSSFYMVCSASTPDVGERAPFGTWINNSNTNNTIPIVYNAELETLFGWKNNTKERIFNGYYSSGYDIWVINNKGGVIDIYRNGVQVSTDYDITSFNTGTLLTIGGMKRGAVQNGEYFFEGDILEFGAYYKQLDFTEIDYLQTGLSSKYSITLNTEQIPLYLDDTDLVVAYEARAIQLEAINNGLVINRIYPVNLGNGITRNNYALNATSSNVVLNISDNNKLVLDGFQSSISAGISSLSPSMRAGTIDQPLCIFIACSFDINDTNQSIFGLLNFNSINNNLLLVERSAINELGIHRRVSVSKAYDNLGALSSSRHIICLNVKTGGLIDTWVDGVKTNTDVDGTTGTVLGVDQVLSLGNNKDLNRPFVGGFEVGYVYGNEKTDQYIIDTFSSLSTGLNIL